MMLRYKKLSDNALAPLRGRFEDAGIDFRLSRDIEWQQTDKGLWFGIAHTGIALEIPRGYYLATAPRSSMLFKKHITVFHSIIDSGYTGEITFYLFHIGSGMPPEIQIGDKIAQCVLIQTPIIHTEFEEVDTLPEWSDRGNEGFGSSGK